jgi:hypothetical protein
MAGAAAGRISAATNGRRGDDAPKKMQVLISEKQTYGAFSETDSARDRESIKQRAENASGPLTTTFRHHAATNQSMREHRDGCVFDVIGNHKITAINPRMSLRGTVQRQHSAG